MNRQKPQWAKLASGLFVPPYLKFAPGYPCCCGGGPCGLCSDKGPENGWEVVIAGITAGTPAFECPNTDCSKMNDTFILTEQVGVPCTSDTGIVDGCMWFYEFSPSICRYDFITLIVNNLYLRVAFFNCDGFGFKLWYDVSRDSQSACDDILDLDVPFAGHFGIPESWCHAVASTCTITAL